MFLGLVRPLTPFELCLHSSVANAPTSASYMRLSPSMRQHYGLQKPSKQRKVKKRSAVQQGQPSSSVEAVRPSVPLSYLDPSKLKRKRLSVGFVSSAATWDAHQHPLYGYTDTDFDYQAEVHLVWDVAMHSYKAGTTRTEMGHLKYWHSFCSIRGLRHWRDDRDANSGQNIAGYQREVDILASFALNTAKIMPQWSSRSSGRPPKQCGERGSRGATCTREADPPGTHGAGGNRSLFIKAQPAGRLSLPGPSAVLVKQLKTGSCHAE